jgi:hypothetical protein
MKILHSRLLVLFPVALAFFAGCKDDSKDTVSPFVGNYVLTQAEIAEDLTVTTVELGAYNIPAGTDITVAIETAILSAAACGTNIDTYIELREDNSIYMSCEGANAFNAGTWDEIDETTLQLNLNSTAIPSSPLGFVLTVSDVVVDDAGLSGQTSVPLPSTMISEMISPLTLDPTSPAIFVVVFDAGFEKK